jgi:Skp family chaperone for outer membrane proteins
MVSLRRPLPRLAAALLVALVAAASPAGAQQRSVRIAVLDRKRVYNEMQETKQLQSQLDAERQRLNAQSKEKEAEIDNLKKQRQVMRPDSPQVEDLNRQILQKLVEYETWTKFVKLDAERNLKKQMRALFNKIDAATADVAKQQNIDLVVAEQPKIPDAMEGISLEQLSGALMSRQILYSGENPDISNAVIALLDAKYKSTGGGGASSPAPTAPASPAPAGKK